MLAGGFARTRRGAPFESPSWAGRIERDPGPAVTAVRRRRGWRRSKNPSAVAPPRPKPLLPRRLLYNHARRRAGRRAEQSRGLEAVHAVATLSFPSPVIPWEQGQGAMPRAPVATLFSLSRRGYAAAAAGAEVHQRAAPSAAMAARVSGTGVGSNAAASSREVFWMRDPQTGCWAPEDRFSDVDAAELRARLLARKD
ncbi:hypothetical protein C2845_PM11G08380 [Panicum miliaceum]|uniref:ABA-responsive LEA-like protein n=1 Tax=Panicum miliaceum TaxID=4540 RepID=A0A3L6RQR4_PANMI|nr:hypothetical protein C2845_PM11G08380 [Panicum miliaceum]